MSRSYDAIVLAGGRSARLGGQPKPQLTVGETTMLDRVLTAVPDAEARVVVGPDQPVPYGVRLVQEDPPGSGPVAGLAAGLEPVRADLVVVLAADLPFLTVEVIAALLSAVDEDPLVDAAILVDGSGRDQYLLGAWRTARLRAALSGLRPLPGKAMRELLGTVRVTRISAPPHGQGPAPWTDIDTPADLDHARSALRRARPLN